MRTSIVLGLFLCVSAASCIDNGLGLTPPMGWNSWNHFACDINETVIYETAEAFIELGLDKLGYEYVNIDDCWQERERDQDGNIAANAEKFPSGIKALADHVHELGLKLGIYTSSGIHTCQVYPASLWEEKRDAETFASWEIDFLKVDNCYHDYAETALQRYVRMRNALNETGRPIFYSICNWGQDGVQLWGNQTGNSWRTTLDITNNWAGVKRCFTQNQVAYRSSGPGHWNDPDMLEVGNGVLTVTEEKTHFALWAFARAPLIIGSDLRNGGTSAESLEILKNELLIAINQDSLGQQAQCKVGCSNDDGVQAYVSWQADNGGYWAGVFVNWSEGSKVGSLRISELGIVPSNFKGTVIAYDLWNGGSVYGTFMDGVIGYMLEAHGNISLKFKIIEEASE